MNTTHQTKSQTLSGALSDIIEVKELSHPQDVNSHIKQGWKLLDTYTNADRHEPPLIKYCLGWPKSGGALNMQRPVRSTGHSEKIKSSGQKSFIYSL